MKWCPQCKRISMDYHPDIRHEVCIWKDCYYINKNDIDLDKAFELHIEINGTSFPKFGRYLEEE